MNSLFSLLCTLALCVEICLCIIVVKTDRGKPLIGNTSEELFKDYIRKYNKSVAYGSKEYEKRRETFKHSLKRIEFKNKHRTHNDSAVYGVTQFSDITPEEFLNLMVFRDKRRNNVVSPSNLLYFPFDYKDSAPEKFDWRDKHVITPVKNQENCGACWAFSTVEVIETMYALKTGNLKELSVQQMVDCSNTTNHGCDGGDTCAALEWLASQKVKLVEAKDYPFRANSGACRRPQSSLGVQIRNNYTCNRFAGDEEKMLYLLQSHGPLVAAVDASSWQDYLGGIIQYHCETGRNHAVQIVGYDTSGEIPYYIVRNSWGENFGNNGYLYIAIGKNLCGIAEEVSILDIV